MRVSLRDMSKAVELTVAGQRCRVVTSASEQELKMLGSMVEEKLAAIVKVGRPVTTHAMLLAAIALANDVIEERTRANLVADKACANLEQLLQRVDQALMSKAQISPEKRSLRKSRAPKRVGKNSSKPPAASPPTKVPEVKVPPIPASLELPGASNDGPPGRGPAPETPAPETPASETLTPAARQDTPALRAKTAKVVATKPIALHRGGNENDS